MMIRRKARKKPWMATKRGRNVRKLEDGALVRPFSNALTDGDFYGSQEWRATRSAVLARDPMCVWCLHLAKATPATEADHIIPANRCEAEGISKLDQSNIVGSCRSCNSRRAAYEARGTHYNTLHEWVEFLRKKYIEKR